MLVLECRSLSRKYDEQNFPLQNINFTAAAGEFIAITGPSGAGKSTLLNILGMLDRASTGEYIVEGLDVAVLTNSDMDDLRGRLFGFVFQASYLISGRSASQNLDAALQYSGLPASSRPKLIQEALNSVGLAEKINTRVDTLSGGERQRVAIARALVHDPKVVFLDEPTGSLDEVNTEMVVGLLEALRNRGITVIVVTHDDRVSTRADRHFVLSHGELLPIREQDQPIRVSPERDQLEKRRLVPFKELTADATFGILSRPFRALMAILIVALAAGGFIVSSGLSSTASHQVDSSIQSASGNIVRARYDEINDHSEDPAAAAASLNVTSNIDGVEKAGMRWDLSALSGPVLRTSDQLQPAFGSSIRVVAVTESIFDIYDLNVKPLSAKYVLTGPTLAADASIVLGSNAAKTIGIASYGAGKTVWIGTKQFSVIGILEPSASETESFDDAALVSQGAGIYISSQFPPGDLVVKTAPGMAAQVAGALPLSLNPSHPEWLHVETTAQLSTLRSTINDQLQQLITATASILILLAVLVTTAITLSGVNSRRGEIALRRAVGAKRAEVAALLVLENSLLGLFGGLLGTATGEIVIIVGSELLHWSPVINTSLLLVGPITGIAVSAIAALIPALRSSSIQPSKELHAM